MNLPTTLFFSILLLVTLSTQAKYHNDQGPINQLMFEAVNHDDMNLLVDTINKGSDVNALDEQGRSPLLVAMIKQQLSTFKYLLMHGADANFRTPQQVVLELASVSNQTNYLTLLLAHGGDANILDSDNRQSILFSTIEAGKIGNVKSLVAAGAQLDVKNTAGETALHHAVNHQYFDSVYFLIEQGASLTTADAAGNTPSQLIEAVVKAKPPLDETQQQWLEKVIVLIKQ